jgi:hypothetical protein
MDLKVSLQIVRAGESAIAMFTSVLVRHILMNGAFVSNHFAFFCVRALLDVARGRFRTSVSDAMLICFVVVDESHFAQVAHV